MPQGTLYVVATPIGNLEDITLRALRILKEAGLIACEDTRQTRKLLQHYGITTPTLSYHDHNEAQRTPELVLRMQQGDAIALVSDAGTPLVSDPGYRLVKAAAEAGINVVPIPGPSAVLGALAAAGLATDSFRFCGFLPPKPSQRRKSLEQLAAESATLVFYEAPHRILAALEDIETTLGDRPVVIARELSKMHEEFLRGTAAEVRRELAGRNSVKGEITLLVGKADPASVAPPDASSGEGSMKEAVEALEAAGLPRMDAIKQVAKARGLAKRDVYKQLTGFS